VFGGVVDLDNAPPGIPQDKEGQMLHVSMRSVRTTLFATTLVSAIVLPASAAMAAPVTSANATVTAAARLKNPVDPARVEKAHTYSMRTHASRSYSSVKGRIIVSNRGRWTVVRHKALVDNFGGGCSRVTFLERASGRHKVELRTKRFRFCGRHGTIDHQAKYRLKGRHRAIFTRITLCDSNRDCVTRRVLARP
jgi:hypothetical protein